MTQKPILTVKGLDKSFGGNHAVQGVSFEVHPGEVVALAGDNGAGKSTVIKMISGVLEPDGGDIVFDGERLNGLTTREIRDRGLETIYQDLALADNLDVGVNLFLGRELSRRRFGLSFVDRRTMRDKANETLKGLGITLSDPEAIVRNLSGGQRQAIAIARAIYWKARLVIMDEPTAALGVPEQREVLSLVRRLREQDVAILFISHNLPDIFAVTDRMLVLARGRLAGARRTSETDDEEVVRLMMGGSA
ncbi:MAG TPA: ATP-binding cassette domain-containing protein [Gammaproteobacteria bacterium]|nr:ATP-binding cassette domain-containing protein [Gammaproteobacteria bacterium]